MIDLDYSFFIQLVNFIITLVILNLLLIDPIRKIIKKRQELMAEKLGRIEQFNGQADAKVKDYQAALDVARKQGIEVRKVKKDEGTAGEHKILSAAGEEAAATMKAARAEVASQATSARQKLVGEVEKYAQLATAKILGQA